MRVLKLIFPICLVVGFSISSCNKDDDEEMQTPPTTTPDPTLDPCNGDDGFCMDYGAENKFGPAKLFVFNGSKVRVFWEEGTGNAFEQIELDIQGLVPGTYNIDGLAIPGSSANVQYFSAANGVVNPAYGTVIVTALDTLGGVTGTFTATMLDSTKITNGVFTNIVK